MGIERKSQRLSVWCFPSVSSHGVAQLLYAGSEPIVVTVGTVSGVATPFILLRFARNVDSQGVHGASERCCRFAISYPVAHAHFTLSQQLQLTCRTSLIPGQY